jgi:hypothetical protein
VTRERGLKVALVAVLLVVAVVGAYVLRQRKTYHQWPWQSLPDRIDHCHRSYAPGDWIEAKDAPKPLRFDYRSTPRLAPHHDVYLEPDKLFTNDQGEQCPMFYFMKDGSGYQIYGLLGGP